MSRVVLMVSITLMAAEVIPIPALGQDPKGEFLRLYRPYAAKVRDAFTNITCKSTTTWYNTSGKAYQITVSQVKCNFRSLALDGTIRMLVGAGAGVDTPGLECQNPKYSFSLSGAPGGQRVLTGLRSTASDTKPNLCFLCIPYADQGFGRSYLDIVQDPATKVISFGDLTWRERVVKQLVVEITSVDPQTKKPESGRIGYCFLPEINWVCCGSRSFDPKNLDKTVVEEVSEYEPRAGEWPVLKSIEQWVYGAYAGNSSGKGRLNRRTEITDFQRSKKPFADSEFTLTAYGFPEPEGLPDPTPGRSGGLAVDALAVPDTSSQSISGWLWVGGLLFLLLGLVFFVLRRRASRRAFPGGGQIS